MSSRRPWALPQLKFGLVLVLVGPCPTSGSLESAFYDECMDSSNMGEELCQCLAEGTSDIPERSAELLVAGMKGDDERAEELRDEMSFSELTTAGMYMVSQTQNCAVARQPPP